MGVEVICSTYLFEKSGNDKSMPLKLKTRDYGSFY